MMQYTRGVISILKDIDHESIENIISVKQADFEL